MLVSYFSKKIKNGSDMIERYCTDNMEKNMKKIVKLFELRDYKSKSSKNPSILMYSVPGCGKTYLAKCIIKIFQTKYDYLWINQSEIMSPLYGETQKRIEAIFEACRKHKKPVIIFLMKLMDYLVRIHFHKMYNIKI